MIFVLFTCDTEIGDKALRYYAYSDVVDVFIYGKLSDSEVGIRFLNQKLSEYGYRMLHFVLVPDSRGGVRGGML